MSSTRLTRVSINEVPTIKIDDEEVLEQHPFVPYRIFLNQVDKFNSRHIASFLTDQYHGGRRMEELPGEGGEEQIDDKSPNPEGNDEVRNKYQIIGTLSSSYKEPSEDITFIVDPGDEDGFREELLKCGFIIYDISRDIAEIPKAIYAYSLLEAEVERIHNIGPKTYNEYSDIRVFILISTIMTWATTKPNRGDAPFTEVHYKKRKCHPDYKEYIACEREITIRGRKYNDKLKTYVACAGFVFGREEDSLDFLFRIAWMNEIHLPIFPTGTNRIPVIHVVDLAKVLLGIMETQPKKLQFILAVQGSPKLNRIVKTISKVLGRGGVKEVQNLEEALAFHGVTPYLYERLTIDLNMEPDFISDNLQLEWESELTLPENMNAIVEELKFYRNLRPITIVLHGPPSSGKTRLSKRICEEFGLHYISIKTLIEETLQNLRQSILDEKARLKAKEERDKLKEAAMEEEEPAEDEEMDEEGGDEEEDEVGDIEEWEEQIRDIQMGLSQSQNGKLPDEYVKRLLKPFLAKNFCQNQGYILDSYPKTITQAQDLFGQAVSGEGGEGGEGGGITMGPRIMPQYVISLQATDKFLCDRIMALQQRDIEGTRYTEEIMLKRLAKFREQNTEDDTVLNFFDEVEVHPILINVMDDDSENMDKIYEIVFGFLGNPVSFGMSAEEEREWQLINERAREDEKERQREDKQTMEEKAREAYKEKMQIWNDTLERLQMEEHKIVVAESEPLRDYLMEFVFPTLTQALIQVAKLKPDDPVDFIAEFLFKENPEGKMFDPSYSNTGEDLIESCKQVVQPVMEGESGGSM